MTLYAMPKPSSMFFPPSITCTGKVARWWVHSSIKIAGTVPVCTGILPIGTSPCRPPLLSLRCHQRVLVANWVPQACWEVHWSAGNCWRPLSHSGGGTASLPAEARLCSCAWETREENPIGQMHLPLTAGRKSKAKWPGDVTRWHRLPEHVDLRSSPPTTSPLLLLQVRL